MLPNYFIPGVCPLPVSPCTIYVYNDILISSPAWNGIEVAPHWRRGDVSPESAHPVHILNAPSVYWVIGPWTSWTNAVAEEGMGEGPERERDLSHFRGELSSRRGLAVVYQILSQSFPKSNTLNLTTLTTQDIHFKPQSSAQCSISALTATARIIILLWFMERLTNKTLTKQTEDLREFPF